MAVTIHTAKQLEAEYGPELAQPPFSDASSPYRLRLALAARKPAVGISSQLARTWFKKYRLPADAVRVDSVVELEDKYGESIKQSPDGYPTGYRLSEALQKWTPPVYVTGEICSSWLKKYTPAVSGGKEDEAERPEKVVKKPRRV